MIEELFTKKQLAFIDRYKAGKKFTMQELESIPYKFWATNGQGLNIKFINEKIIEDLKIRHMDLKED